MGQSSILHLSLSKTESGQLLAALDGGSVPTNPAPVDLMLQGYDDVWVTLEAEFFGTRPEDIVEGCLQHARYLLTSNRAVSTTDLESTLYETVTHSASLSRRVAALTERTGKVSGRIEDEIARVEIRCPKLNLLASLSPHTKVHQVPGKDSPPPSVETAFLRHLKGTHRRSQFIAPDLFCWVIQTASQYHTDIVTVIRAAIRTARLVMKNAAGAGTGEFRREILARQMEIDRTALQLDRQLQSLEKIVPRLELLAEVFASSADTLLRRAAGE